MSGHRGNKTGNTEHAVSRVRHLLKLGCTPRQMATRLDFCVDYVRYLVRIVRDEDGAENSQTRAQAAKTVDAQQIAAQ